MIKIDYICDNCKSVQTTKEQFWAVRVSVRPFDYGPGYSDKHKEQQWCQRCTDAMGLLPMTEPSSPLVVPTLEDVIREIIREEVEAAMEATK